MPANEDLLPTQPAIQRINDAQRFQRSDLNLSGLGLTTLPPELFELHQLEALDLTYNDLERLSPSFEKLSKLRVLYLHGNMRLQIPPEILGPSREDCGGGGGIYLDKGGKSIKGDSEKTMFISLRSHTSPASAKDILRFYFTTQSGQQRRKLLEAKVLIVGQGSVGKTSLVNRLIHSTPCAEGEHVTRGIVRTRWAIAHPNRPDNNIRLNIWDFGGQEIMHATHQFFLTRRSLYVLVLDARLDEQACRLGYWLRIIESFSDGSPAIIAVNKVDLRVDPGLPIKQILGDYPFVKGFVNISCLTGYGMDALLNLIRQEVAQLPHIEAELLDDWFRIKDQLELSEAAWMPYTRYQEICRSYGVKNEQDQDILARFLHDLGVILNFRDDRRLLDTNIINPRWVTEAVYEIINNYDAAMNKGVLSIDQLLAILSAPKYPRGTHQYIVDVMTKFEIAYRFEETNGQDRLLVPGLLDADAPDIEWDSKSSYTCRYTYLELPSSVISRFIVRIHPMISSRTCWRSGVLLALENGLNKVLVRANYNRKEVSISVRGAPESIGRCVEYVRQHLDHIHSATVKISPEFEIPIPMRRDVFVSFRWLEALRRQRQQIVQPPGCTETFLLQDIFAPLSIAVYFPEKAEAKALDHHRSRLIVILFGMLCLALMSFLFYVAYMVGEGQVVALFGAIIILLAIIFSVVILALMGAITGAQASRILTWVGKRKLPQAADSTDSRKFPAPDEKKTNELPRGE